MTGEFTITIDDFREALRANGSLQLNWKALGWIMATGLLLPLTGRLEVLLPPAAGRPPGLALALARVVLVFAPLLAVIVIYGMFYAQLLRNLKDPRPVRPWVVPAGWLLACLLAALHVWIAWRMVAPGAAEMPGEPGYTSAAAALMPAAYWFGFYTLIGLLMVWFNQSSIRRIWNADVTQHRPKSLQVAEGGLVVADAVSRHEERWLAFTRYRESPRLFLVYVAKSRYYIVPKRAFAADADVARFRDLLWRNVAERTAAFPVWAATPERSPAPFARPAGPPPLPPPPPPLPPPAGGS